MKNKNIKLAKELTVCAKELIAFKDPYEKIIKHLNTLSDSDEFEQKIKDMSFTKLRYIKLQLQLIQNNLPELIQYIDDLMK